MWNQNMKAWKTAIRFLIEHVLSWWWLWLVYLREFPNRNQSLHMIGYYVIFNIDNNEKCSWEESRIEIVKLTWIYSILSTLCWRLNEFCVKISIKEVIRGWNFYPKITKIQWKKYIQELDWIKSDYLFKTMSLFFGPCQCCKSAKLSQKCGLGVVILWFR